MAKRESKPKLRKDAAEEPPKRDSNHPRGGGGGHGGNGGGGGGTGDIHPAFLGLLKELPPVGVALSERRKTMLVEAFKNALGFLYPEPET